MKSYDFGAKDTYRWRVWRALLDMCGVSPARAVVAYLDTPEALETRFLIAKGFRPENLWAINRSAARIAWTTMRLKLDGIVGVNTIGADLLEAAVLRLPQVHAVNYDGMSNLCAQLVTETNLLYSLCRSSVFGFTLLAGRESPKDPFSPQSSWVRDLGTLCKSTRTSYNQEVSENDARRVQSFLTFGAQTPRGKDDVRWNCLVHYKDVRWDRYISTSGQPMIWLAVKTVPHCSDVAVSPINWHDERRFLQLGVFRASCSVQLFEQAMTGTES